MANSSTTFSPLRYPGGKNRIYAFVESMVKENGCVGGGYAEPYAGGAGVALRLLISGVVKDAYINDYDRAIYAFWWAVLNMTDELCQWIETVPITMETWDKCKEIQGSKATANLFDLAQSTLFLNRTNMSGIIKGGPIGGRAQTGTYKLNARFNRGSLIDKIQLIANYKDKIHIENLDALEFVESLRCRNVFIYFDPPYFKKGHELYMNYYKEDDHVALKRCVEKSKKRWMLSYDEHDYILKLYSKYSTAVYTIAQSTSNRIGKEILVFSSQVTFENSLHFLSDVELK